MSGPQIRQGACLCGALQYEFTLPLAGALDWDPGVGPLAHIFVGSKARWFEITDAIQQYPELPPSF